MMNMMFYKLRLRRSTVFDLLSAEPTRAMGIKEIISYLQSHPNDKFMHKYLINRLLERDEDALEQLVEEAKKTEDFLFLAALYQTSVSSPRFRHLREKFDEIGLQKLAAHTPLIYIRWALQKDLRARCFWMDIFARNKYLHNKLPSLKEVDFPIPFDLKTLRENKKVVQIKDIYAGSQSKGFNTGTAIRKASPAETIDRLLRMPAMQALLLPDEVKLTCSISPYAFRRSWKVEIEVSVGRNSWKAYGLMSEYGKGFTEEQARASTLMEIVERCSALGSFAQGQSRGYKKEFSLIKARYSEMKDKGYRVLDPNKMSLEVAYQDQELYWVRGEEITKEGSHEIYIPAQFVFLISSGNFDEVDLYSQGTSTNGLASGNTIEEAKLTALLEYIERDSEKVGLFSPQRCFSLQAEGSIVGEILNKWEKRGVHIYFLDLTSEFGIPCYQAFFVHTRGGISKGWGAHLDGKIAVNRALCELTSAQFHYDNYSTLTLKEIERKIKYQELPNYSSGDVDKDLWMLERVLIANGLHPIYANLTRKDLNIPVIRAIIPGLEMLPDLDRYSPFSERLFRNYLKIVG